MIHATDHVLITIDDVNYQTVFFTISGAATGPERFHLTAGDTITVRLPTPETPPPVVSFGRKPVT